MPASREREVDVAYALEGLPHVAGVYALNSPPAAAEGPDALEIGVVLQPFTGEVLAAVHFALHCATSHDVAGRILYTDSNHTPSRIVWSGKKLTVDPSERDAARARFLERSAESVRVWKLEEEAMAQAIQRSFERRSGGEVRVSMQSGVFEVVGDPFREEKARPPVRVLVIDRDPVTTWMLRSMPERFELFMHMDAFGAVEEVLKGSVDLVVCGVEGPGARMLAVLPEAAGITIFLRSPFGKAVPRVSQRRRCSSDP